MREIDTIDSRASAIFASNRAMPPSDSDRTMSIGAIRATPSKTRNAARPTATVIATLSILWNPATSPSANLRIITLPK